MVELIAAHYKTIFIVVGLLNVLAAVLFFIWSGVFDRVNHALKKYIHTEKIEDVLNKTMDVDAGILKMRKILAFISSLVALILIVLYLRAS